VPVTSDRALYYFVISYVTSSQFLLKKEKCVFQSPVKILSEHVDTEQVYYKYEKKYRS
jgi:hypothetical protein